MKTEDLTILLVTINDAFPPAEAGMGSSFKGRHSITLDEQGNPNLNLWWRGRQWPILMESGDVIDAQVLAKLRETVDAEADRQDALAAALKKSPGGSSL